MVFPGRDWQQVKPENQNVDSVKLKQAVSYLEKKSGRDGKISDKVWISKVGQASRGTAGPLTVHKKNPRYFTDAGGRAVYLTGSHTWDSLVDMGLDDPPKPFNFPAYLKWMEEYNHNFIRMWTWEPVTWKVDIKNIRQDALLYSTPQPWARTGPGLAMDGKPRFDLKKYNREYFDRLRSRVEAADKRGIYVSIMLFEGWAMQFSPWDWEGHPFYAKNNINNIDGDVNKDGKGLEVYTLKNKKVTALQEAYVRKVIDTVNNLNNVLYEISNENHSPSTEWQYHMIRFIKNYEKTKPKQHPVGMTFQQRGGNNETLFKSPADWISPNPDGGYRNNPPIADGRKVVLTDTDHLWGIGGNSDWVWKSFLRGHNPIFMDPYRGIVLGKKFNTEWEPIRRSMGHTLWFARRMNLAEMTPRPSLASSRYCLAHPGCEYLVYLPQGGKVTVDLKQARGKLSYEWFDSNQGIILKRGTTNSGRKIDFNAPFKGPAVLYIFSKGKTQSKS